jgi:hypothetical protein
VPTSEIVDTIATIPVTETRNALRLNRLLKRIPEERTKRMPVTINSRVATDYLLANGETGIGVRVQHFLERLVRQRRMSVAAAAYHSAA